MTDQPSFVFSDDDPEPGKARELGDAVSPEATPVDSGINLPMATEPEIFEGFKEELEGNDEIRGIDSIAYALPECEFCHGEGYVPVDDGGLLPRQQICGCVLEGRRRHACEIRINSLFGSGGAQMTFARYRPGTSTLNADALRGCLNYIEHFPAFQAEGAGFALMGEHGCGKTHLATATLIGLIKRWPGPGGRLFNPFYTSIPALLRLARKRMDDKAVADVIERAMYADICFLDDIGAEYHRSGSEGMSWVDEQLYIILDYRLTQNLPTLYTTNLKKSALKNLLDPRIIRRLDTKTLALWPVEKNEEAIKPSARLQELLTGKPSRA